MKKYLVLVFFLIFSLLGIQIYRKVEERRLGYRLQTLEKEIEKRRKENNLLREKIASFTSWQRVEKEARKRLGMITPREIKLLGREKK